MSHLTKAGREAISAAQTKRWNKFRREQKAAAKKAAAKKVSRKRK